MLRVELSESKYIQLKCIWRERSLAPTSNQASSLHRVASSDKESLKFLATFQASILLFCLKYWYRSGLEFGYS
ncbi:hypothetical protein MDA_GLEAN10021515 [Myotis davidii]|uniref:Uncharacterized protein n=1 Tax=Myotis davidii TaxID=225400 RepID=L5M761_MYODS|nr:hypothetical protein MDA_GLEAN10021515 [Myotis davidii]